MENNLVPAEENVNGNFITYVELESNLDPFCNFVETSVIMYSYISSALFLTTKLHLKQILNILDVEINLKLRSAGGVTNLVLCGILNYY